VTQQVKFLNTKHQKALPGESQKIGDGIIRIYTIVYGLFDKIIHFFLEDAYKVKHFQTGS
jgi:hypothetical protein